MEYTETTLRTWLTSGHAEAAGHKILDLIAGGDTAHVQLKNGNILELVNVSDALNHLRAFGWTPRTDRAEPSVPSRTPTVQTARWHAGT
jgi:hypothetical protein